jgi:hypothetical protein
MHRALRFGIPLLLVGAAGGCPEAIEALTTIEVQLINQTSFEIDPAIHVGTDSGLLGAIVADTIGAEPFDTGRLGPGERASFRFDCEALGLIVADNARQHFVGAVIGSARSFLLRRDRDFACRDTIQFHFIGSGDSFEVVAVVNGRLVE